jgi:hypothetical protein
MFGRRRSARRLRLLIRVLSELTRVNEPFSTHRS